MRRINLLLLIILCLTLVKCKKKHIDPTPAPTYNCSGAFFNYTIDGGQSKNFFVCSSNASVINGSNYYAEALTIKAGHIVGYSTDTTIILNIFHGNAIGTYQLLSSGSSNVNSSGTTIYTEGTYETNYSNSTIDSVYKTNNSTSGVVNITRYDNIYGGFIEGNFNMTVKNAISGTTKVIVGSFRLKINSL